MTKSEIIFPNKICRELILREIMYADCVFLLNFLNISYFFSKTTQTTFSRMVLLNFHVIIYMNPKFILQKKIAPKKFSITEFQKRN